MGRQRTNVAPLKARERQTFRARSQGLIKKAMELSILTESKITLLILDEKTGNIIEYNSAESLIENVPQRPSLIKMYTKQDYEKLYVNPQKRPRTNKNKLISKEESKESDFAKEENSNFDVQTENIQFNIPQLTAIINDNFEVNANTLVDNSLQKIMSIQELAELEFGGEPQHKEDQTHSQGTSCEWEKC